MEGAFVSHDTTSSKLCLSCGEGLRIAKEAQRVHAITFLLTTRRDAVAQGYFYIPHVQGRVKELEEIYFD
jgi:hypothetical protein